jgi:hypothetical protein
MFLHGPHGVAAPRPAALGISHGPAASSSNPVTKAPSAHILARSASATLRFALWTASSLPGLPGPPALRHVALAPRPAPEL